MNQRAAELGLLDTHFCNPHGLHEDDHYAYDLACLAGWLCSMKSLENCRPQHSYTGSA